MAEMITVLSTNLFRTFILKRFMSIFFEINIEEKVTIHSRFDGTTNKAEL